MEPSAFEARVADLEGVNGKKLPRKDFYNPLVDDVRRWNFTSTTSHGSTKWNRVSEICEVTQILPLEVVREVRRHFDDSEKTAKAKFARKNIAYLLESGAEEISFGNTEP